jgi:unconventional prefoldin RPB5 interactor 1
LQKQKIDNQIKVSKANKNATDEDRKNEKDLANEKKVIDLEEKKRLEEKRKTEAKERADRRKQEIAEAKAKADEIKKQTEDSDKQLQLARLDGREKEKKQLEFEQAEALKAVEGNTIATQNVKDLYKIKESELNKKFLEEDKKTAEELEEFKNQLYLDGIKNAELRAEEEGKLALEKKIKEIEDSKLTAVEKEQAVQDAIDVWQQTQDQKNLDKKLTKDAELLANDQVSFEEKYAILAEQEALITELYANDEATRTKMLDENAKARKTITEKEAEAKVSVLKAVADTTATLSEAIGKDTAAGKALAVASALINTYQGITAGVKLGFPQAIPAVLAASVTGFKAVKQILAVKVPNGGGGAGGNSVPSSTSIPTAPIASAVQIQQTDNIGTSNVNIKNTDAIKAYVVERDITDSQDRINKIKSAATI